jgi:hypothetical protein
MARLRIDWRATSLFLLVLLVGGTLLAAVTLVPGVAISSLGGTNGHYSANQVSRPSRDAALAAMEQLTDPSIILSPQVLQINLGTSNLPSKDPVVGYLQALSNFTLRLQQIRTDLQSAQVLASEGKDGEALLIVNQLVGLRSQTMNLLTTMYNMLDLIQSSPNVNQQQIQAIRARLDGLRRIFTEYSVEIDQLESQVTPRTPRLTISVSNISVFVNQPLTVRGQLEMRNGTAMMQRNVTIIWENNLLTTVTDPNGSYTATIAFRPGDPNGTVIIGASFQPTGPDARLFSATNVTALTQLKYYPTLIMAETSSRTALPLDSLSVTGSLVTSTNVPLENRSLSFLLDNSVLGEAATGSLGAFAFSFQIPPSAADGNHTLQIVFLPQAEVFAATEADLPITIQRGQTQITTTASTSFVLSGINLKMTGIVSFAPNVSNIQSTFRGNMTILLDGTAYGSFTVGDDGSFSANVAVPLNTDFGNHALELLYSPLDPRIDVSIKIDKVYVYNTEIIAGVALAAVLAPQFVILRNRRRRLRLIGSEAVAELSEEPLIHLREVKPPISTSAWESELHALDREEDPSQKVVVCYRLVQNLIANKFEENLNDTETHWEFYKRAVNLKPELSRDLRRLVELFELAEYSQYRIDTSDSNEAFERLLNIRDVNWS